MFPDKIKNYRIVKQITKWGITKDFLAINEQIDKKVILRVSKYTEALKRRLQHITKAHASMNHPNIHDVYDFFEYDDTYLCIVLKYIEGEGLDDFLNTHKTLNLKKALHFTLQISNALAYMHEKNIINGGIKPSAVLIENNRAYITKFNNIKKFPEDSTLPKDGFLATVRYSSPEQLLGFSHIVPQSDIWSLGILLYEMLTGQVPFRAKDDIPEGDISESENVNNLIGAFADSTDEILNKPLTFPETIPDEIQELLSWMLQRSITDRCPSCKDLSDRITWLLTVTNAFVALPFHEKFTPVRETIKSVCKQMGVDCYIVDEANETGDIVRKIRQNIKGSHFVIADMSPVGEEFLRSGQKVANSNVIYEVGVAHGFGKNVILLTQDLSTLSFDIAQETAIVYDLDQLHKLELDLLKFMNVILKRIRGSESDSNVEFLLNIEPKQ